MAIERGRIELRFQSERYLMRTLTPDDASSRWAGWLNDPVSAAMLNARPRSLTVAQLRDYIASFDQVTRLLVGIFDRASGEHIGIAAADIIEDGHKIVPSVLIGEAPYRHIGVISELAEVMHRHFFEELAFDAAIAYVLARNEAAIALLRQRGWTLARTLPGEKISARTGEPLDLHVFEMTRESWRRLHPLARAS